MDARIEPLAALGLEVGDAHVLRNAGAVASQDVIRSLAISTRLLGTEEALVVGHTDCGMVDFTNEQIRERLAQQGVDADGLDFYPFDEVERSVRDTVAKLRASPLLPDDYPVAGLVYDVATGRLRELR